MSEIYRPTPEAKIEKPKKLTREEVKARLANGESLENLDLADLDLAGLDFEDKSFRGSDIRGVCFYEEKQGEDGKTIEIPANLRRADFTDAIIADLGPGCLFVKVDAKGAAFGYTEDLISRRNRHAELKKSGERPEAADTGGLYNFNGGDGNFRKTKWINVDFAGGSGYEAIFPGANLSESEIVDSDLAAMDLSTAKIDGIKIKDPLSLRGLVINEQQTNALAQAIELTNEKERLEFSEEVRRKGPRGALEDYFGIIVAEIKD